MNTDPATPADRTATRTTPPRPFDVTAVLPDLAPLARTATRLHPRPGTPSVHDSSIGGPLLWPARQPWPHCDRWHEGPPVPLIPVVQLYARDAPRLRSFGRADLLQVLWCPAEHDPDAKPRTVVSWRNADDVTDPLAAPPEPFEPGDEGYVPSTCVLVPEEVTEYPDYLELDEESRERLADPDVWRAAGVEVEAPYGDEPQQFYSDVLSRSPGSKLGGWAPWGRTDPVARYCVHCGAAMGPLLTIASSEWDGGRTSWVPIEDRALVGAGGFADNPTGLYVGSYDSFQIYTCPNSRNVPYPGGGHGHTTLIQ